MKEKRNKINLMASNEIMMLIILICVFILFTVLNHNYLSYRNISNILMSASTIGLMAIGETYLIIAGHIDLSCANMAAMLGVISALMINVNIPWGFTLIIVIAIGAVAGMANATLVNVFKLQPFIATLAMANVFNGTSFLVCNGKSVPVSNASFTKIGSIKILGIPFPAVIMVIFFVIFGFILSRTVFGRSVYMIGGNAEAARLAGLNPKRISAVLYVLSGMIAAFAGFLMCAKMHSGQPNGGAGSEFDAITSAILGGVALTGGTGNLLGCFIGLLIMQGFNNGLTVVNVSAYWQIVAKGLLLVAALIFDFFRKISLSKRK